MSLGSDLLEALRLVKREAVVEVAIFAASRRFLDVVTPNDANTVISFEKLTAACDELVGCLDFPLFLGLLEPGTDLPPEIEESLRRPRPRDLLLRPATVSRQPAEGNRPHNFGQWGEPWR
jgi:hypothetical protein